MRIQSRWGRRILVARSEEAVLDMRDAWRRVPVSRVDAELDFYLAVVRSRPEVQRPHVVLIEVDGIPSGILVGRIERVRLETRIGYRSVYRPAVRSLTIVHGGVIATSGLQDLAAIRNSLEESLRQREADVIFFPSLRVDSTAYSVFGSMAGPFRRQHVVETRSHRRLELPASFDEFLASRSKKIRSGIRYDTKKLLQAFGEELEIEMARDPADFARVMAELPSIAEHTYQHALGASFSDTEESRNLVRLALRLGWFRSWVLYRNDQPIAFWQGMVYDRVYYSGSTGYHPEYRRFRVGIYLLMRVIADLCADPEVDYLDFGFGDAEYKRHFSSESWEERDVTIFAPTFRAVRINCVRTVILMLSNGVKRILERLGAIAWLKTRWRSRLAGPKTADVPEPTSFE